MTGQSVLRRLAAITILVAGGVHFDLWIDHGYRSLNVIGPLFLLNSVAAAVIATLLASRGETLVQVAGLGYALSTLTAFFVSVYHGLFGFTEALNGTRQLIAALAEAAAVLLLAFTLTRSQAGSRRDGALEAAAPTSARLRRSRQKTRVLRHRDLDPRRVRRA